MRFIPFLKNKKEFLLWGAAVFFLILILIYGGGNARFIARIFSALSEANLPKTSPIATFNLEKLDVLLKEKGQTPTETGR